MARFLTILSLLLILSSWGAFPKSKNASSIEKRQKQLHEVHLKLRAAQKRLEAANVKERDLSHQLNEAQLGLHKATDNLNRYSTELRSTGLNLNFTKRRLAAAQEQFKSQTFLLTQRLTDIYQNGKVPFAEFLFGARSYSALLDRLYYLGLIVNQDIALAREINLQKQYINSQKIQLTNQYQKIYGLRQKVKGEYVVYSSLATKREGLLGEVREQRQVYAHEVTQLQEISAALERELEELIRREQERLRASHHHFGAVGALSWPVGSHMITSPYGWRVHPIFGGNRFHTGVDIGAGTGSPIHAAADGVVIYSGWYDGYGQAVILDHGNGLSTLYAHCSALYVHEGQSVYKGETIAAVGSTGNANGPHLHFEVRENGTAVDPMGRF